VSYDLASPFEPARTSVTFNMNNGALVDFDLKNTSCVLDIYSNVKINMADYRMEEVDAMGNYSKWVDLNFYDGVAVTGLTSCGAVFVADQTFSCVAAAHMGGDAQFAEDWCEKLVSSRPKVVPYYILWGTGPDGSRSSGGKILLEYAKHLNVPFTRAPAVAACGAIFLARTPTGIAAASRSTDTSELPFKRTGQAVRTYKMPTREEIIVQHWLGLDIFNSDKIVEHYLMIQSMGVFINYKPELPFTMDEKAMERTLSLHAKQITTQYVARLPVGFKAKFSGFKIFKQHPEWIA
jgi:hypothetical protein